VEIKKYQKVASTNTLAKRIGPQNWQIIWAQEQSAGYGRNNNRWFSPPGGLYFSIILPQSKVEDLQILTILAAFIVAKILTEDFGLEAFIKLPNDVYIKQKKVAGILTENVVSRKVKFSVMGIGLNTNIEKFPQELENRATSLKIELGKKVENEEVLKKITQELKRQLATISE